MALPPSTGASLVHFPKGVRWWVELWHWYGRWWCSSSVSNAAAAAFLWCGCTAWGVVFNIVAVVREGERRVSTVLGHGFQILADMVDGVAGREGFCVGMDMYISGMCVLFSRARYVSSKEPLFHQTYIPYIPSGSGSSNDPFQMSLSLDQIIPQERRLHLAVLG